jgi:hypothetical protein
VLRPDPALPWTRSDPVIEASFLPRETCKRCILLPRHDPESRTGAAPGCGQTHPR